MNKIVILIVATVLFLSCRTKDEVPKRWVFEKTIQLDGVNPIGAAKVDGSLWVSDGDHNRLVRIGDGGKIVFIVDSLQRPMHIDAFDGVLYVPLYGQDEIFSYEPDDSKNPRDTNDPKNSMGRSSMWDLPNDSLDAPAGVSVVHQEKAIADFYNSRILYSGGSEWISIGKEGKAEGEFYYPTDVQITEDKIWVADAYNHRVQVFDKMGNFLQVIGQEQKMNAATGLFVSEKEVFVTDFENNRVLVFDLEGNLKQEIRESIEKPTDILLWNNMVYVLNYRNESISTFRWEERPESGSDTGF